MRPETISAIRNMTLQARQLLFSEASDQLEGIYGFLPDGRLNPAEEYPFFAANPKAAETRQKLENLIADEKQVGISPKRAREKLVGEAAFTWLNRFVAFKMLEARRLVKETVTRSSDSNGFKIWLTEPGNEENLKDYEVGDLPQDGLGEGPRQRAYRHFLLSQCSQLAQEIRVLFDPDNLASNLCPRPSVMRELIALLNQEVLAEAWPPGNEETIGWVYQFFVEQEKKNVFDRLFKKKEKIRAQDIPAATQIFTPRWVVRYLVENTLGRLWLGMHPDSELGAKLKQLVPTDSVASLPLKSVSEIKLLDPACGTMHFGLLAFDLFVEMYREEVANAGRPGWPDNPPVDGEDSIPSAILANNIHGIDIDLRAVQLSALTLYLKAKTLNSKASIFESHLACADIHMLDGARREEIIKQSTLDRPIYKRILSSVYERIKDAEQLGSLLQLEKEVQTIIQKERSLYGRQKSFDEPEEQEEKEAGIGIEYWESLEGQMIEALHARARELADEELDQGFFTAEATKGLRLLEIMRQSYDVVLANPPYLANRNMNAVLKEHLKKHYPVAKGDLYAAFIQRCTEWLANYGFLGMITQQSFMFISSYEGLRNYLRQKVAVESMPHVGPRAFAEVTGEKVNTTLFVFRRESNPQIRDNSLGTYFRLVKEPDGKAKRRRLEQALANLKTGKQDPIVYRYRQSDFDAIPGSPWVYWITPGLRHIFTALPKLEDEAKPRVGLQTGDNFRFLRYWWEVGKDNIAFGCPDAFAARSSGKRWFPYMKGGGFQRWYGNQEYVVNWHQDGAEIRKIGIESGRVASRPQNTDFYFRRGVTYSYLTSGNFSARLSPGGYVFDVAGSSLFPGEVSLVLAVMNSYFATYALKLINPTVNFQVGDLARLPIPETSSDSLASLVNKAIDVSKHYSQKNEVTLDFIVPTAWLNGIHALEKRRHGLTEIEATISEEVYRLYGVPDEDRDAIEKELSEGIVIEADQAEEAQQEELGEEELSQKDLACQWISYAVGIVMRRFQPGIEGALGHGDFSEEISAKLRSLADTDGVIVLDPGHYDDIATKVYQALETIFGHETAVELITEATARAGNPEEELRRYFERSFFKEHIQKYGKRPVYWLLQSPRKKYGVWIFHEKLTRDTLYRVRSEQYVGSKQNLLEAQLAELRAKLDQSQGRERRQVEKQIDDLTDVLDDVRQFAALLDEVLQRGYTPHIDDGVLINMAPLWQLIPSWQVEPKKCWEALEEGDYDWARQAMEYWPERVRQKCKTNKSFAIAHGLEG